MYTLIAYFSLQFETGRNWNQRASRNGLWDGYWGYASQLLVNFSPAHGNSPRSLFET